MWRQHGFRHSPHELGGRGLDCPLLPPSETFILWTSVVVAEAAAEASLLFAAFGTEDIGSVGQEPTSDESDQALGTLEAPGVPLATVERDEFRIVYTYRVARS